MKGPLAQLVDIPTGRTYLNTATEGLPIRTAGAALQHSLNAKRHGSRGREELYALEATCRDMISSLLGITPSEVALVPDTSTGIDRFVNAFPWRLGDEVLLHDLEFPSNVTPWLEAQHQYGIHVRVLRSEAGVLKPEEVARGVTEKTRVISFSHVSFKSGGRIDLKSMSEIACDAQAILCVDATQSLGVVPPPFGFWDVLWSSSYKWLLGVHGVAIMAVRKPVLELFKRGTPGWRSISNSFEHDRFSIAHWHSDATRFQAGMPSFASISVLIEAIRALQKISPDDVLEYVLGLGDRMLAGLEVLQIAPLTPDRRDERAGIIAFESPEYSWLEEQLDRCGIDVWARDGRVRFAFHAYNTIEDVDHCLRVLAGALDAKSKPHAERIPPS
jgi:selenocysteine lyase/cysteine desulfurase